MFQPFSRRLIAARFSPVRSESSVKLNDHALRDDQQQRESARERQRQREQEAVFSYLSPSATQRSRVDRVQCGQRAGCDSLGVPDRSDLIT